MSSQAKRETYTQQLESGAIRTKTVKVLYHLQRLETHPGLVTTDILRETLGYSHQTLTAILSQLQDLGMIKVIGTVRSQKGSYSSWKYVSDREEQKILERERKREKYDQWVKRGLDEFDELLSFEIRRALIFEEL
jgi:hypothetical protein